MSRARVACTGLYGYCTELYGARQTVSRPGGLRWVPHPVKDVRAHGQRQRQQNEQRQREEGKQTRAKDDDRPAIRPAKAPFTAAADRVLKAGGALEVRQEEVDFDKLPAFFRDFAVLELEAVSRCSFRGCCRPSSTHGPCCEPLPAHEG